jgi:hypothetical protein
MNLVEICELSWKVYYQLPPILASIPHRKYVDPADVSRMHRGDGHFQTNMRMWKQLEERIQTDSKHLSSVSGCVIAWCHHPVKTCPNKLFVVFASTIHSA